MLRAVPRRFALFLCLLGLAFAAEPPGVWLDVPFVKQEKNGCGAASIAMVMQYWRKQEGSANDEAADAAAIQRALYSRQAHGIYASQVAHYFQRNGFRTFVFRGEWSDLRHHLVKGRPLIVALKPPGIDASLHYVVVTGLDWAQQFVLINDPAQRKLLERERSNFEKEWKSAGNWTLLAVPQQVEHGSVP